MLRFLYERFNKIRGVSDKIHSVYIMTPGNICTNKCYMCPGRSIDYRHKPISDETYSLILSQLADIAFDGELHLYGQNEPFLDRRIFDMIDKAHSVIPNAKIALISNFTVMNDSIIDRIMNSHISYFSASIYSLKKEGYLKICGKDNFEKSFVNQIKFLKRYATNPFFSFAFYIMANNEFIQDDIEFCKYFIHDIAPVGFMDFYALLNTFNSKYTKPKHWKGFINNCIYDRLFFLNDGDVSICSIDAEKKMAIGNVHKDGHIRDLINNSTAKSIRRRVLFDTDNAHCNWCDFGRQESKWLYFIPMPSCLRKALNRKLVDSYDCGFQKKRFTQTEILNKLKILNDLFKDNCEDEWLSVLSRLRQEFYSTRHLASKHTCE